MDFIIVNSGFLLGYFYKYSTSINNLIAYIIGFNAAWLIIAYLIKLYSAHTLISLEAIFRSTWKVMVAHTVLISIFAIFIFKGVLQNKLLCLGICYSAIIIQLILSRFFITYIVEFLIKKGKLKTKIAIVGFNAKAKQLAAYFSHNKSVYSFQGYFSDMVYAHHSAGVRHHHPILAPVNECIDYAVAQGINEIYSTLLPGKNEMVNEMLIKAEHNCVRVKFVADEPLIMETGDIYIPRYMDGFQVIHTRLEPLENFTNKAKKRMFDMVCSFFVIFFILSWLIPIMGLLIKLESKGPVFFIQKRSGRYNKVFGCIKFRSMKTNGAEDVNHTSKGDSRITRLGSFLRKNSLDELPQFLNVFAGSMSVIGPRPHMLAHTEQYRKIVNSFMVRQFLKPGISGWAQVNGLRGEINKPSLMERRVACDIWYMENWSLMLDIKIIFMTIINMIKGDQNAY